MNETSTIEKTEKVDQLSEIGASAVSSTQQNNPNPTSENPVKKWIKKIPFFSAMDYFRRKV